VKSSIRFVLVLILLYLVFGTHVFDFLLHEPGSHDLCVFYLGE